MRFLDVFSVEFFFQFKVRLLKTDNEKFVCIRFLCRFMWITPDSNLSKDAKVDGNTTALLSYQRS